MPLLRFTDETIQAIFGHEAAENEDVARLRQYYFKTPIFQKVTANLPLRLLVGHKGVGKSALFTIAIQEDRDAKQLPILIRPDEIAAIGTSSADFLRLIRDWKQGLQEIIVRKVLDSFEGFCPENLRKSLGATGRVFGYLKETLAPYLAQKGVSLSATDAAILARFLKGTGIDIYVDDIDQRLGGTQARYSTHLSADKRDA